MLEHTIEHIKSFPNVRFSHAIDVRVTASSNF